MYGLLMTLLTVFITVGTILYLSNYSWFNVFDITSETITHIGKYILTGIGIVIMLVLVNNHLISIGLPEEEVYINIMYVNTIANLLMVAILALLLFKTDKSYGKFEHEHHKTQLGFVTKVTFMNNIVIVTTVIYYLLTI